MEKQREEGTSFMVEEITRLKSSKLNWAVHELEGPSQPRTSVDQKEGMILQLLALVRAPFGFPTFPK